MSVIECDVPASSALDRELVGRCDFRDSWRVQLSHPELGMAEIFFAVFGHTPLWMKAMLILRNALARLAGLEVPTVAEIMKPEVKAAFGPATRSGPGRYSSSAITRSSPAATTSTWISACRC